MQKGSRKDARLRPVKSGCAASFAHYARRTSFLHNASVMSTKRIAILLRVSTSDQTVENQRRDLLAHAERRGWTVVKEDVEEAVSGAKAAHQRPVFAGMLKDARRRRFDMLAVWAIDRLGRSTATVATTITELRELGIDIYADKEGVDSTTAHGRAMLEMAAVFANLEREQIKSRIHAGVARARAQGKHLGRPSIGEDKAGEIRALLSQGHGMLKVAGMAGVGSGTVQRIAREMRTAAA